MTEVEKDALINKLLIFMKNDIEEDGLSINSAWFDFDFEKTQKYYNHEDEIIPEGNALNGFKKQTNISDDDFRIIINICQTHGYVKNDYAGRNYKQVQLTDDGLARAVSVVKQQHYKPQEMGSTNVFHGPVSAEQLQIGNNNTQNIEIIRDNIIKEIEKSNASKDEKDSAMKTVMSFFGSSIITNALGLAQVGLGLKNAGI